jgi:hypothetical protein
MAAINSADEAAAWAHRSLPAKNTLTAADAKMVEERVKARLSKISDEEASEGSTRRSTDDDNRRFRSAATHHSDGAETVLVIGLNKLAEL